MTKDRRSREAEALRANLLKRKAQLRARAEKDKADAKAAGNVQEGHREEASASEAIAARNLRR